MRLALALGLVCLGGLLFPADLPVARWCREHRLPGDLARFVELGEVFGHSLSVATILLVTFWLDPFVRQARHLSLPALWDIGRMVLATYAGGIVVDGLKLVFTRVRPRAANLATVDSILDTFGTAAWQMAGTDMLTTFKKSADLMSFPSGHSAVAAGLATTLAWKYPHGWPIFAALAALAGVQRVFSAAHYPSDVAFGAACGVTMAAVCLAGSRPTGAVLP